MVFELGPTILQTGKDKPAQCPGLFPASFAAAPSKADLVQVLRHPGIQCLTQGPQPRDISRR